MKYEDLLKQIRVHQDAISKLNDEYVSSKTTLKKGDIIEFIEKGDSYNNEPDNYHKGKIYGFKIYGEESIYVEAGNHQEPILGNVKLFDSNDFELRDRIFLTEMEMGDSFYLTCNKTYTTKDKEYTVVGKSEDSKGINYKFINDKGYEDFIATGEYRNYKP